ncbi:flagellin [Comamonas aquatica]|uniref:flagellin n=1 Tax=Comamonas aquatica TaxID=225991 RepID=UPI00244917F4|nr:flagellin [Comamonas aquatica]MDH0200050.1 flagellin [Comamonas aquatica]MDH1444670.1 flagellin [Comamonas aquatica]MDH1764442.1 flagellin [Comamonas aquatica]
MAATINTNIASINAQRNLSLSGQSLNTTMQRLSSGLRVNSAKDDAAGLAIAERMNTQVKGLTVASRNANDGISLAQTAEGALGKIGDMLQRQRELAVQASNATNSASDREALQAEVSQLTAEIDRVAKQTNFNGQKILDGSFAGAVFQVGANSGDNVTLGALVDTRSSKISNISYGTNAETPISTLDDAGNATLENFATTVNGTDLTIDIASNGGAPTITSVTLADLPPASSRQERLGQVVEAINGKSADTGVTAYLTKIDGTEDYTVTVMSSKLDANGLPVNVTLGAGFTTEDTGISAALNVTDAEGVENAKGIDDIDVTTQEGAWIALKKIDSAVDQVNGARATLGAMQTRFENAVNNIDIQVENLSAARGRIVDADFAVETANLSRTQILQQAGTAMVAQANQIPQNVLKLLQS